MDAQNTTNCGVDPSSVLDTKTDREEPTVPTQTTGCCLVGSETDDIGHTSSSEAASIPINEAYRRRAPRRPPGLVGPFGRRRFHRRSCAWARDPFFLYRVNCDRRPSRCQLAGWPRWPKLADAIALRSGPPRLVGRAGHGSSGGQPSRFRRLAGCCDSPPGDEPSRHLESTQADCRKPKPRCLCNQRSCFR